MSFSFDPWAVLAEIRAEASGPAKAAKAAKAGETVATLAALAGWHAPEEKIGPARSASAPHPEIDTFAARAAIAEHDGGLTRPEAEVLAARDQGFTAPAGLYAAIARHWLVLLDSMEPGTDPHAPDCIAAARSGTLPSRSAVARSWGWLDSSARGGPRLPGAYSVWIATMPERCSSMEFRCPLAACAALCGRDWRSCLRIGSMKV